MWGEKRLMNLNLTPPLYSFLLAWPCGLLLILPRQGSKWMIPSNLQWNQGMLDESGQVRLWWIGQNLRPWATRIFLSLDWKTFLSCQIQLENKQRKIIMKAPSLAPKRECSKLSRLLSIFIGDDDKPSNEQGTYSRRRGKRSRWKKRYTRHMNTSGKMKAFVKSKKYPIVRPKTTLKGFAERGIFRPEYFISFQI